jgi:hypothetical protein
MSSMTVGIGIANRLLGVNTNGGSSAVLYYEIVLKNKGNASINNLQLSNNLLQTFGTSTISNVQVSFVSNPANLVLNSNYNGVTDTNLLAPGQMLNNFPLKQDSLVLQLQVKVSDLMSGTTYENSVLGSGAIGSGANLLVVKDASNDGNWSRIDIDRNGISDDPGENVPTRFILGTLAMSILDLKATETSSSVNLSWSVAANETGELFEIQRSSNGNAWQHIATLFTSEQNGTDVYTFSDAGSTQNVSYRLKIVNKDGTSFYSTIISLKPTFRSDKIKLLQNPVQTTLRFEIQTTELINSIAIYNMSGMVVYNERKGLQRCNVPFAIALPNLTPGTYILEVRTDGSRKTATFLKQ